MYFVDPIQYNYFLHQKKSISAHKKINIILHQQGLINSSHAHIFE